MSVTSVAGAILSVLSASQGNQQTPFSQINTEFQQLGQDLQAGNLNQAQVDFNTLAQSLAALNPPDLAAPNTAAPLSQVVNELGQDIQQGNLPAAQQDLATLQQDLQQGIAQASGRHHHHTQNSQANPLAQEFSQLSQSLQAGNLQGAQQAFQTLQNDLQQINAFALTNAAAPSGSGLNMSA